jgi:TRAP-type C4-dicarboxylate transport system permease large subunit
VLQGMTQREIGWIAKVTLPFFFLMIAAVGLIYAFPQIVTWLPLQMKAGAG